MRDFAQYSGITRELCEFSILSERLSLPRDAAGAESARLIVELALRTDGEKRERGRKICIYTYIYVYRERVKEREEEELIH